MIGFQQGRARFNPAYFRVHKNGSDQTGLVDATETTVTWGTEEFDNGGYFASNAWTPPAGTHRLFAQIAVAGTNIAFNGSNVLRIKKNGNPLANFLFLPAVAANPFYMQVGVVVEANGTDAYAVTAQLDTSSSTATISGAANVTYFEGWQIK